MPNKQISVPNDVYIDVHNRQNKESFNFSGWITQIYREKFMSGEVPQEIEAILELKYFELDESEKKFLRSIDYGSDHPQMPSILTYFNREFGREVTIKNFLALLSESRKPPPPKG